MKKNTKTIVHYTSKGVLYRHTFPEILNRDQIEQRLLMDYGIARRFVKEHIYA